MLKPNSTDNIIDYNKCLIWNIGILFYRMYFGKFPFVGMDSEVLYGEIQKNSKNFENIYNQKHSICLHNDS